MAQPRSMEGKTVVITGAGGLLGCCFAETLSLAGATVLALDLPDALTAAPWAGTGGVASVKPVACDVASESDVVETVRSLWEKYGPIDGLVNNAASKSSSLDAFFAGFEASTLATWREVTAVNLDGSYLMARELGSRMAARGSGSIVQVASIYGVVGPDQRIYEGSRYLGRRISSPAVYSASKAGVLGLVRYLCTWWSGTGVRVNAITPGGVTSGQNAVFEERYSERVPLGRMAEPSDIAGPLEFLLSDSARYVNGHNLVVDGGLTVW